MRAVVCDRLLEDPRDLGVVEVEEPTPGPGEVRIRMAAAGCNFFDILLVQGRYQIKPEPPFTPGGELAGTVDAVGGGVEGLAVGDRVLAGLAYGAFAEAVVAPARAVRRLPDAMSFEEAAGFPIVYPTSWAGLVFRGQLQAGETLLVHAAAGGVGLAAVQIGKALGARVIGTASPSKLDVVREEGADVAIDYRAEDWMDQVREATDGRGADVIYDSVGGDVFDASTKLLAWAGRLVVVGFASGRIPEIRANRILLKNVAITGVHWGAYEKNDPAKVDETFASLFELAAAKKIRPRVSDRFPLDRVADALEAIGGRKTVGKVVLVP